MRLSKSWILHLIHHLHIWWIHTKDWQLHGIHLRHYILICRLLLKVLRNKVHILLVLRLHVLWRNSLLFVILLRHLLWANICLNRSLSVVNVFFFCS